MAGDNLETSGLKLVADGADKFTADLAKANKAYEGFGASIRNLASMLANGGSFEGISKGIGDIASKTSGAVSAMSALGSAGGGAGAAVATGISAATVAIGGLIAIAGAAVLAIAAIGNAVNSAVAYGSQISRLSDSTGLSGGLAQSLSGGAAISGNSVSGIAGTFNAIGANAEASSERAEKALGKIGAAADKSNTRLQRLNDDYARGIADITTSAAERIQESNDRLVESHAAMLARQARADEDYAREVSEGRAALGQRLADIEASTAESIARLSERQTRGTDTYTRETLAARDELAQSILDIQTNLDDKLASLRERAADQSTDAVDSGAKTQAKIQEDLQSQLYNIEQKYSAKRQSLQEKIFDPNTNPILRAYYKTQLGSLRNLQTAEEAGARAGASAKEEQARRETAAILAEVATRLAREEALEQTQASRDITRLQQTATQRQAERDREYAQQSADLAAQITRENAQRDQQTARARSDQAVRESDLKRSYDRQASDAKAAYDKQVLDAAAAQLKIQAETEKRLAAEKLQYDRAIEDINAALASAGGGGASAAAAGIDKVKRGFDKLGISAADFAKLSPDQQFKLINDRIAEMVNSGDFEGAIQLVQDLTGVRREEAVQYVRNVADMKAADEYLKLLGWTQEQIDNAVEVEKKFNLVKAIIAQVGNDIGAFFIPVILDLFDALGDLWKQFKNDLLPAIERTYNFIKGKLEGAFTDIATAAQAVWNKIEPLRKLVDSFTTAALAGLTLNLGIASVAFNTLKKGVSDVYDFLDRTFGPALTTLKDGIIADFIYKIGLIKTGFDNFLNLSGQLAGFFDGIATNIGKIDLPDWLKPSGGSLVPSITYPPPPSSYGNPYNTGGGVRSVPATPAQMSAGRSTTSNTTNTSTASVVVNVANGTQKNVMDGVVYGMYKAGFTVVR